MNTPVNQKSPSLNNGKDLCNLPIISSDIPWQSQRTSLQVLSSSEYVTKNYTVGILDDNPVVLSGLKSIIQEEATINLCFISDNPSDFLIQLKIHQPQVLIVDVIMNHVHGPELFKSICENYPRSIVIAFSNVTNIRLIKGLYSIGINAFVSKTTPAKEMFAIIDNILRNDVIHIPENMQPFISEFSSPTLLTQREISIGNHIKNGLTNKEIAQKEFISINTVAFHKKQLFKKFGVRNSPELVREIIAHGYNT